MKKRPLSKGFGRVVKIKKSVLDELLKAEDLNKVKEILSEIKYHGSYEFGSGKGIFRVGDIRGKTTEEIMKELAIPKGELEEGYVYVAIEIKTDKEPGIFEDLDKLREAKSRWHWPFTGNGFIANGEGEILPEYYLKWNTKDGQFPTSVNIDAVRIITENGVAHEVGWL